MPQAPTWPAESATAADAVAAACELLRDARRIVVFTGAGVSTDSGIPDFRSPGGLWSRYDPRTLAFGRYVSDAGVRTVAWRLRSELHHLGARPNAAHLACAELATTGRLAGVITQNIDGLHADAGLPADLLCEIHGTTRLVTCLGCGASGPMSAAITRFEAGDPDPTCTACGGILKAATVSFGQRIPPDVWRRAEALASRCDALLAVGSSLVVRPASRLPLLAKAAGADLAIVNREPTPLDPAADVVLRGEAGTLLPALVRALAADAPSHGPSHPEAILR